MARKKRKKSAEVFCVGCGNEIKGEVEFKTGPSGTRLPACSDECVFAPEQALHAWLAGSPPIRTVVVTTFSEHGGEDTVVSEMESDTIAGALHDAYWLGYVEALRRMGRLN